jgi:hypothetical protein
MLAPECIPPQRDGKHSSSILSFLFLQHWLQDPQEVPLRSWVSPQGSTLPLGAAPSPLPHPPVGARLQARQPIPKVVYAPSQPCYCSDYNTLCIGNELPPGKPVRPVRDSHQGPACQGQDQVTCPQGLAEYIHAQSQAFTLFKGTFPMSHATFSIDTCLSQCMIWLCSMSIPAQSTPGQARLYPKIPSATVCNIQALQPSGLAICEQGRAATGH